MKIYNEIVIDMNPESSSYGKTLHEDSFDYEGDLILMQNVGDIVTVKEGATFSETLKDKFSGETLDFDFRSGGSDRNSYKNKLNVGPGMMQTWERAEGTRVDYYPEYKYTSAGIWEKTGNFSENAPTYDTPGDLMSTSGDFTYTKDETGTMTFDPTSEEFQTSVGETGGFDELVAGFGLTDYQQYFDPVNMDQLGFLGEAQNLAIQQGALDTAGAEETRRAATSALDIAGERNLGGLQAAEAQYGRGRRGAGQAVGQSLYAASQQQQEQASRSGFAGGGGGGGRAQRGIMADYNLQQEELAAGFAGAKSAFDITQREITSGRTATKSAYDIATGGINLGQQQAGLDYRSGVSQFWDAAEDDFYDQLTNVEGLK